MILLILVYLFFSFGLWMDLFHIMEKVSFLLFSSIWNYAMRHSIDHTKQILNAIYFYFDLLFSMLNLESRNDPSIIHYICRHICNNYPSVSIGLRYFFIRDYKFKVPARAWEYENYKYREWRNMVIHWCLRTGSWGQDLEDRILRTGSWG